MNPKAPLLRYRAQDLASTSGASSLAGASAALHSEKPSAIPSLKGFLRMPSSLAAEPGL